MSDDLPIDTNYAETDAEPTARRTVWRLRDGGWQEKPDLLVVEEPLEIRVDDRRFTITMRTPGEDLDLARGLLFAEGMVRDISDIGDIRHCDTDDEGAPNLVTVQRRTVPPLEQRRWQRTLMSGSSCGLCGKAAMEAVSGAVAALPPPAPDSAYAFAAETLLRLPDRLRAAQTLFTHTGGLHAAGIFDINGNCLAASEDIGRHNATDKVIGRGLREGWLPADGAEPPLALLVSGRASFEIVQKALMARIPVVCSVSAASALAAELAEANNQTLLGFLRGTGMTIYAGRHRVRTTTAITETNGNCPAHNDE